MQIIWNTLSLAPNTWWGWTISLTVTAVAATIAVVQCIKDR